jgi:hypothetical protein
MGARKSALVLKGICPMENKGKRFDVVGKDSV